MNRILNAVLASRYVVTMRKKRDMKDEIEFYGHPERATDVEIGNIEGFFEQELEEIVKIVPVWEWLQKEVKDELDGVWSDPKTLLSKTDHKNRVVSERSLDDMLAGLCNDLTNIYRKKLNETWTKISIETARRLLPKGLHIALLDKDGNLTREPYPTTTNAEARVKWEIKEEELKRRYIHISVDPPVKTTSGEHKGQMIRLNDNEVKAKPIRVP